MHLLSLEEVKYFVSISDISVLYFVFLTKPQTPGILFSTSPMFVLRTAAVTKLLTSHILLLTSAMCH